MLPPPGYPPILGGRRGLDQMVRLAGHGAEHGHPGYLPFLGFFGGNNRSWPIARAATHPGRLEANAWLMRRCGGDWDWYRVSQNPQRPYIL